MALDVKIIEAIQEAVEASGQSPALARRLIAWLDAVTSGNEDINDMAAAEGHLDQLYAETAIEGDSPEEET